MKEIPYLGELLAPEYYHEIQGFESRLAILKLNDVQETLGDCATSLIYSDCEEQKNIENLLERNVIRRFHIRHAIVDLNNCYDLLLQVPWFFYRCWESFNKGGSYYDPADRYYKDVIRNNDNWVEIAEEGCSKNRVYRFLSNHSDKNSIKLTKDYKKFENEFIFNKNKSFTIRTLANSIKHHGSLKIKELCTPWKLNLTDGKKVINPRDSNLGLEFRSKFFTPESGKANPLGEIRVNYSDDLYVDIEYTDGEIFLGKDYVRKGTIYSIEDLHKEAVAYFENFLDLFRKVYNDIKPQLSYSPIMNRENFENPTDSINLDKYFKTNE